MNRVPRRVPVAELYGPDSAKAIDELNLGDVIVQSDGRQVSHLLALDRAVAFYRQGDIDVTVYWSEDDEVRTLLLSGNSALALADWLRYRRSTAPKPYDPPDDDYLDFDRPIYTLRRRTHSAEEP